MNLYVVRHGETEYNKKGIFQGHIDVPLNNKGKEQALEIAKTVDKIDIDIIISSPLKRALQTAEEIANRKKLNVIIDKQFIERSFGKMEGKKPTENLNIDVFTDFDLNYNENLIESIIDFQKRIYNGIENLKLQYTDKNILLVTHTGVIEMITAYFYGVPKDKKIYSLGIKNCGIRKFEL